MGAWLEAYETLDEGQKSRVQKWLHLNKFIARTLRLDWETWVDDYLKPAMAQPLDYGFMADCVPDFQAFETRGQGVTFSTDVDPATAQTARVPLRASNHLGAVGAGQPRRHRGVARTARRPAGHVIPWRRRASAEGVPA